MSKESTYYVHPIGDLTNTTLFNRLGQEGYTAECLQKRLKGGGTVDVCECPSGIVEELCRSKKRMQLSFTVYMLQGEELVPADVMHLIDFETEPQHEASATDIKQERGGKAVTVHRKHSEHLLA
jgi:hypothetical protein